MITIVADTTCGLSRKRLEELKIPYLPQIIVFGEDSFRDDYEIDTPTFLKKLRASSGLPKTAAPPPDLYKPVYEKFGGKGNTIIVITPSAEVSGTARSALVAAQEFPDSDIRVIDTRTIAGGLGSMVVQAQAWAKAGLDADTIVARVQDLASRERCYFVVDTLEYLYKGGRIGGAKALFGSILQIKPILTLTNGRTEPVESQRTRVKALARLKDLITAEMPPTEEAHLTFSHCEAEDVAGELAAYFSQAFGFKEIPIYEVPPAIVVHGGPKIISASYFRAPKA